MAAETFADRLRRLASQHEMSEADLASALGVSATQAARLLDGTTKTVKLDAALRLCRRLGISPWELAGESDPLAAATPPKSPEQPAAQAPDRLAALETLVEEIGTRQTEGLDTLTGLIEQVTDLRTRLEAVEHARAAPTGGRRKRAS